MRREIKRLLGYNSVLICCDKELSCNILQTYQKIINMQNVILGVELNSELPSYR